MKPNIQTELRDEAVVQARQTIERRVNELGVTEPSIAQQGNGDQILVQLPGVTDVDRAKEIIGSTGLLELKIVEQGPVADAGGAAASTARCRAGMEIVPGVERHAGRPGEHGLLPRAQGGGGHRPRFAQCAAVAGREQPAGRQLHAEQRRRRASSAT